MIKAGTISFNRGLILSFDSIANVPVADAYSLANWNTFFDLPAYGTPFTGVRVLGNRVRLLGGSGITIKTNLFYSNYYLRYVQDTTGVVVGVDSHGFYDCSGVTGFYLPALASTGSQSFRNCTGVTGFSFPLLTATGANCFYACTGATGFSFPLLTAMGEGSFVMCTGATGFSFLLLTAIGGINGFYGCTGATSYNLPSLATMGATVGDNSIFAAIAGKNIILTIPAALMTCNGGAPDGDIQYLQANNTVTIITV